MKDFKEADNSQPTHTKMSYEEYLEITNTRRVFLTLLTPAEMAIHNAILSVEQIGADVKLTEVVMLLLDAKNKLADYVDIKLKETNI